MSNLSKETIIENNAEHLGFSGYFLYQVFDDPSGIIILGKLPSFDTVFEIADLLDINIEVER